MKNWRIEAIILAVGLSLAGVFVRNGLSEFSSRSRVVTVKGLAEMEVKANTHHNVRLRSVLTSSETSDFTLDFMELVPIDICGAGGLGEDLY